MLLAYGVFWRAILVFPLWILIMTFISFLITKFKLLDKIFGLKIARYRIVRILFGLMIMIPLYFLSLYLAAILAKPINNNLDEMNLDIENIIDFKKWK